ncbi:uncharacterized protein LOC129587793 [Paramacrobiotus metropolitanus]|uniref:uncharacterized protein LOC129587793 n=1 Tax=Paramacrobiotus metropolitanus TaxID=2943436 RepID=UPI002445D730|nr:uncharacterized protein LOC129587793 [Paramacrobiotus metropolitanus]
MELPCAVLVCFLRIFKVSQVNSFVINTDPTYPRWPGRTIPYYFNPGDYSQAEMTLMQAAMTQISSDMGNQFQFIQRTSSANNGQSFVIISRSGSSTSQTPAQTCVTFPGMVYNQNGVGQYMSMVPGRDGCLLNIRQAMRLFVSLMGLRSEHRKPSRDTFITFDNTVMTPVAQAAGSLAPYNPSQVLSNSATMDYNSITLLDDQTFTTTPGDSIIDANLGQPIFNSGRLSLQDCQALGFLYSIATTVCQNPFLNGNIPPANNPNNGVPSGPDIG